MDSFFLKKINSRACNNIIGEQTLSHYIHMKNVIFWTFRSFQTFLHRIFFRVVFSHIVTFDLQLSTCVSVSLTLLRNRIKKIYDPKERLCVLEAEGHTSA